MSEKESVDKEIKQPPSHEKEVKRYSGKKNKKVSEKQNELPKGSRTPRGKKQRRQFKLAPNRG
ncbi:MAG TPA: hypothetical protein VJY36_01575 [Candidatus Bathyarchaeia archaeon]|nr:hypothetical protein [Candidatus Bathyarchaeia archaeon]